MPKQDESGGHDLLETKQRLSAKLMPLDFISGVGIAGSKLAVYLVRPLEPEERSGKSSTPMRLDGRSSS